MNHELAAEIRLFAQMIEMFHGEYSYQGWVHTMRQWANKVDALAAPDKVWVIKEVDIAFNEDRENLSSIHATLERAEEEIGKEWGESAEHVRIEAWAVHQ